MGGVVAEEHGEATAFESFHGFGQVAIGREGWTPIVFDSCDDERVGAASDDSVFVEEKCPTVAADAVLQFFHIGCPFFFFGVADVHAVVVIAHDGIDAVGCVEFVEVTSEPVELCALVVDEVACEEDGVALLGVDEVNDGACVFFMPVAQGADVHVGELCDAVAVELFGQVGEVEGLLMDDIVVASDEVAEGEECDGKECDGHGNDADDAHEEAVVAVAGFHSSCDHPVDALSDAVDDHEEGFGGTEEEEGVHVDADPCLMLRKHVVAGDDDGGGDGDADGRQEPKEPQPFFLCPMTYVNQIDVDIWQNQQEDDE